MVQTRSQSKFVESVEYIPKRRKKRDVPLNLKIIENVEPEDQILKNGEQEDQILKNGEPQTQILKNGEPQTQILKNGEPEDQNLKNGEPEDQNLKNGEPEDQNLKNGEPETQSLEIETPKKPNSNSILVIDGGISYTQFTTERYDSYENFARVMSTIEDDIEDDKEYYDARGVRFGYRILVG
jgi:hypothetical protein